VIERLFANAPTAPDSELWLWRLLFRPVRWFILSFIGIEVRGREHVPARGPYVIVANHINWKDPPAVSVALGVPIRWMAKREVFDYPILGFVLRGIGNFAIRRGESDRRAIALALRVLEKGLPLGVFPEGHRSDRQELQRAQPGVALVADRANVLIVPCGIAGTAVAGPRIPRRTDIVLSFGRPFRVSELSPELRSDRQVTADAIMLRVAEQLPPPMRGVYSRGMPGAST